MSLNLSTSTFTQCFCSKTFISELSHYSSWFFLLLGFTSWGCFYCVTHWWTEVIRVNQSSKCLLTLSCSALSWQIWRIHLVTIIGELWVLSLDNFSSIWSLKMVHLNCTIRIILIMLEWIIVKKWILIFLIFFSSLILIIDFTFSLILIDQVKTIKVHLMIHLNLLMGWKRGSSLVVSSIWYLVHVIDLILIHLKCITMLLGWR